MKLAHFGRRELLCSAFGLAVLGAVPSSAARRGFFSRHKLPIGVQLYTLGDLPLKDLDGTLRQLARIGFREVELPGFFGKTPQELRTAADRAGLRITSIHLPPQASIAESGLTLESDAEQIAAALRTLGATGAIMPVMLFPKGFRPASGEDFPRAIARSVAAAGTDIWKRTAAFLNERGAALKREGIQLGYHNHNLEFARVEGTTGWDILVSQTDPALVSFELDVAWAAAAGLEPLEFVKKHAGRARWLHVKDFRATTRPNFAFRMDPTEVGSGVINWKLLLPAAVKAGVRHFYVEQEPPFTIGRMKAVAKSFAFLQTI
jgi:sugar phosphate isomerase/epimerase